MSPFSVFFLCLCLLSPCDVACGVVSVCVFVSKCGVCVGGCGVCVCRVVWHAEKPPCVDSTRLQMYIQNVPVYAGNTGTCFSTCTRVAGYTRGRFECTHGKRFESTHGGGSSPVLLTKKSPRRVLTWPHRFTKSNQWM